MIEDTAMGQSKESVLRVAAIYPAFAPQVNEMAIAWQRLTDAGLVDCRVVAGGEDRLKASSSALGIERLPNLEILRVPGLLAPGQLTEHAVAWAAQFKPDVVFCALQLNVANARRIARRAGAPILLHVETWLDETLMPRRRYLGLRPLRPFIGRALRHWYRRRVSAVAFSDPREIGALRSSAGFRYLAWPHPRWSTAPSVERDSRALDTVLYVGSLYWWKGAEQLGEYGERLLSEDSQAKFEVVGPALDRVARRALDRLAPWRASGRFRHIERLPRAEAMAHISRSLAVVYAHPRGGWGLIGDAWGCGTPVIAVASHYDIEDGVNALVAPTAAEFVATVQRLRHDTALWQTLSRQGRRTAESKHGVEISASHLLEFLRARPQH
jgi:glycosyltransferase involved in cell wall biosynthesis